MPNTIKVYKDGRMYLPKKMIKGLAGQDIPLLQNYITVTLIRPGSTPEDIIHSLKIALQDYYLQEGKRARVEIEVAVDES